jgi:hypothetical protein
MELAVQNYLRNLNCSNPVDAIEKLHHQFNISVGWSDSLVILNYSMIESTNSEIENDCRALILDISDNFNVVFRAFSRFFNYGEKFAAKIDWDSAEVLEKMDGSLVGVFNYKNQWRICTRKTIDAKGDLGIFGTFADSIWKLIPNPDKTFDSANLCYVFEFISPKNRIVTPYEEDELVLLTIFDRSNNAELSWEEASKRCPGFRRPRKYDCKTLEEVIELNNHIQEREEGFVVVDSKGNRIKIKNPSYLTYHRVFSRGGLLSADRLFDLSLDKDREELVSYFPDMQKKMDEVDEYLRKFKEEAEELWETHSGKSIKDFALSVKDSRVSSFLFTKYRNRELNFEDWINDPNIRRQLSKGFKS